MKGIAPLRAAGISLLAGTDVGFPYVIPGKSLHKELALLVEAGLTPAEALATATSNPARFLGLDNELGAIKPGWIADLVVLRADPLRDISAVSRIETVIANGRVFLRPVLDQLLQDASRSR
jgi:imidazolonepropionase-like amidohydrolase